MAYSNQQQPASWAFLRLIRADNLVLLLAIQFLARIFLIGPANQWRSYLLDWRLWVLSVCAACIVAAGFIINDYYDVKIDSINQPQRVLVGHVLKRRVAILWHSIFNVAGIGGGILLSWRLGLVNLGAAVLVWAYSNQLRRTPLAGNLALGVLSAIAILAVGIYERRVTNTMWMFAIFAYCITIIRSLVKDMADLRGDMSFGCKTLPIVWGIRRTKAFIYLLLGCCVAGIVAILPSLASPHLSYFFMVMVYPLLLFSYRLYWADTKAAYLSLGRLCKNIMVSGIFAICLA